MTYYVLLNGTYDHTFVGPFRSEVSAETFATEHENDTIGAFILTRKEWLRNIKEFGTLPVVPPAEYQPEPEPQIEVVVYNFQNIKEG